MPDDLRMHDLQRRWLRALAGPAGDTDAARATFAGLAAAYGAEGRHYHTLAHIEQLLALVAAEAPRFGDTRTVELAAFFHDAVYDVQQRDNERASAAMADSALRALGVAADQCRKIAQYIEATAHLDAATPPADPDLARFLDLDLAILAAPPAEYDAYAAAVRREYAIHPDADYRRGRAQVLATFLGRTRVYLCDDHHAGWDASARANLQRELASLL